jgi:hypothetical protein
MCPCIRRQNVPTFARLKRPPAVRASGADRLEPGSASSCVELQLNRGRPSRDGRENRSGISSTAPAHTRPSQRWQDCGCGSQWLGNRGPATALSGMKPPSRSAAARRTLYGMVEGMEEGYAAAHGAQITYRPTPNREQSQPIWPGTGTGSGSSCGGLINLNLRGRRRGGHRHMAGELLSARAANLIDYCAEPVGRVAAIAPGVRGAGKAFASKRGPCRAERGVTILRLLS